MKPDDLPLLVPNQQGSIPVVPRPLGQKSNGAGNWSGPKPEPVAETITTPFELFASTAPKVQPEADANPYPWEGAAPVGNVGE